MMVYVSPAQAEQEYGVVQPVKIKIDHVDLVYDIRGGTLRALDSLNLDIYDREFVCVVGPSGCGKTTLLQLIAGLLNPSSGRLFIDGRAINGPGADRAVVFQDDAVFPWLTVEQNIEYGPRVRAVPKAERRKTVDHYLQLVQLEQVRHLYPRELSGGMRKRVDMARAFANNPDVLLMDEPFGMLDMMTKEHLQQETLRIWETTQKTICFITHDLEEALYLADRVVVMQPRPGRIHEIVEVPFKRPRHLQLKTSHKFQQLRRELQEAMTALSAQ